MRQPMICQACGCPIAPAATRWIGPAPRGGIWAMHAHPRDCLAALNARFLPPTQEARHAA